MDTIDKAVDDQFVVGDIIRVYRRGRRGIYTAAYRDAGEHRRRSLQTRSRREAERRASKLLDALEAGPLAKQPVRIGLDEAKSLYLSHLQAEGRSAKTLVKYSGELVRLTTFFRDRDIRSVDQITPLAYDAYRVHRSDVDKTAPYTAYNLAIVAKQWLRYLLSRDLITTNPLAKLTLRMPRRNHYPAATLEQLMQIILAIAVEYRAVIVTLALTGMRLGEVLGLHRDHIDLQQRLIRLSPTGGLQLKTQAARRDIPIHPALFEMLVRIVGERRNGLLFTTERGQPFNPRLVNTKFVAAAAGLGMTVGRKNLGLTVHALRRSFKTIAFDTGVPKPLIDRWLGHADRSMDAFYYAPQQSHEWMTKLPFVSAFGDDAGVKE